MLSTYRERRAPRSRLYQSTWPLAPAGGPSFCPELLRPPTSSGQRTNYSTSRTLVSTAKHLFLVANSGELAQAPRYWRELIAPHRNRRAVLLRPRADPQPPILGPHQTSAHNAPTPPVAQEPTTRTGPRHRNHRNPRLLALAHVLEGPPGTPAQPRHRPPNQQVIQYRSVTLRPLERTTAPRTCAPCAKPLYFGPCSDLTVLLAIR